MSLHSKQVLNFLPLYLGGKFQKLQVTNSHPSLPFQSQQKTTCHRGRGPEEGKEKDVCTKNSSNNSTIFLFTE